MTYNEDTQKNKHLVHIEDALIDYGSKGLELAIKHFEDLMSSKSNVTVKYDGSPAIFVGHDPSDGEFFVAKKSIFNKNPKVYKSIKDINNDTEGSLNSKLSLAFTEFSKLGISTNVIIQGDLLFSSKDTKKETIDGKSFVTFHPNTIVYAIPETDAKYKQIQRSNIGVVWHTIYRGKSFETMSANFGEKVPGKFKEVDGILSIDPSTKSEHLFDQKDKDRMYELLSKIKHLSSDLKKPMDILGMCEPRRIRVNAFINRNIKSGYQVNSALNFSSDCISYIGDFFNTEIEKKKSTKGRASAEELKAEVMDYFVEYGDSFKQIIDIYKYILELKTICLNRLNQNAQMNSFLKTNSGYEYTEHEGFVISDQNNQNAFKLVNRLEFSRANFSNKYIKGWN